VEVQKILREWQAENDWAFVEHSKECAKCGYVYITGDVVFVYPAPAVSRVQEGRYECAQCGMRTLMEGEEKPIGMSVSVQKEHLSTEMPMLAVDVRRRIEEGFGIVDKLMAGLEAAAQAGKTVAVDTARKMMKEEAEVLEEWKLPDPS